MSASLNWPSAATDGGLPCAFGIDGGQAGWLETKADLPSSLAEMEDLLARMRGELAQQFQTFADLRDGAMRRAADDQPEAEAKLARADLKAAVEALSVIVRTLEKVDQLDRQMARDRAEREALPENRAAHEAVYAEIEALIEARVEERLARRIEDHRMALAAEAAVRPGAPPMPAPAAKPAVAAGSADASS